MSFYDAYEARNACLHLQELADALSLTYDTSSSSKPKAQDNVQRLATARQQILETCNQLRDYLVSNGLQV
jgi:hypothetical protein